MPRTKPKSNRVENRPPLDCPRGYRPALFDGRWVCIKKDHETCPPGYKLVFKDGRWVCVPI